MKTTLSLNNELAARLKREAARQGRTMSELVEDALRLLLQGKKKPARLPKLPRYRSGGLQVDISDRDRLYDYLEGR